MNTGVQDAANLGWKLAFLSCNEGPEGVNGPLLGSYDRERRPVARRVMGMTHLMFWLRLAPAPSRPSCAGSWPPSQRHCFPCCCGVVCWRRHLAARPVLGALSGKPAIGGLSPRARPPAAPR